LIVKLNNDAVTAIEAILKKGDKAVIQRNGSDVIIMAEKRKVEYRTDSNGSRERAI